MSDTEDDLEELSPDEQAEAEEAAAWLHERIIERLAGGPMTVTGMQRYLMDILSPAEYLTIAVEQGDTPGTLKIVVPKGMLEVITAFRVASAIRH